MRYSIRNWYRSELENPRPRLKLRAWGTQLHPIICVRATPEVEVPQTRRRRLGHPAVRLSQLGFLDRFFGGGFGFRRGGLHCFRVPKVGRDLGDFVGRIAELRADAIENGVNGLDGIRADLQVFLVTLRAEDFGHGGVMVEAS